MVVVVVGDLGRRGDLGRGRRLPGRVTTDGGRTLTGLVVRFLVVTLVVVVLAVVVCVFGFI